jgi:hypothetical protein
VRGTSDFLKIRCLSHPGLICIFTKKGFLNFQAVRIRVEKQMNRLHKWRNFRSIEWYQKHTSKSCETIPLKRILKHHPFSNDPIRSKTYEIILFRVSYYYVRDESFVFERNFSDKKSPQNQYFLEKICFERWKWAIFYYMQREFHKNIV